MTPQRLDECKKICACVPFIGPDAGVEETMRAMRELIQEVESSRAAIAKAAGVTVDEDPMLATATALKRVIDRAALARVTDQHSEAHHRVLDAMSRFGGGFVSHLAGAWRRADATNHARLHAAFGGYYREYANMVAEQKRGGGL